MQVDGNDMPASSMVGFKGILIGVGKSTRHFKGLFFFVSFVRGIPHNQMCSMKGVDSQYHNGTRRQTVDPAFCLSLESNVWRRQSCG